MKNHMMSMGSAQQPGHHQSLSTKDDPNTKACDWKNYDHDCDDAVVSKCDVQLL